MSRYLEEAAEQLRLVAQTADGRTSNRRMECARAFALLAAIEKGLLPQEVADAVYGQFGGAA